MEKSEIETRLRTIFRTFSKPDAPEITDDEPLSGRFDSLTILEMVFRFEDEFQIEIDTAGLHDLKTFRSLVDAVEKLVKTKT